MGRSCNLWTANLKFPSLDVVYAFEYFGALYMHNHDDKYSAGGPTWIQVVHEPDRQWATPTKHMMFMK